METDNQLDAVERKLVAAFQAATLDPVVANIKYPNGHFTTPNNANWIRINTPINSGPFEQDASGCYEINQGFMVIQVFTPKGSGSQTALKLAQQIKSIYTAEQFDDLMIESVVVSPAPEPESSPWYGINCQVNFTFEGFTS